MLRLKCRAIIALGEAQDSQGLEDLDGLALLPVGLGASSVIVCLMHVCYWSAD